MSSELEKLYKLKILSLLHDPPSKSWIMAGLYKAHEPPKGYVRREAHENEALWMINELFPQLLNEYKYMEEEVETADRISAALDRWILSMVAGKTLKVFQVKDVRLINALMPEHSMNPKVPTEENVRKFINTLRGILELTNDWRLRYHLLYALYEPLWHEYNDQSTGPADTRVPTSSIFDHCYASSAISNIVSREGLKGTLVRVDLAGPQKLILASRKVRDLWISSWLASALAWSLVEKLVRDYGPDILIKPSSRNNPFYAHTLLRILREEGLSEKLEEKLEKVFNEWYGYDINVGFPRHAVIPSQIDIILPGIDVGQFKMDMENLYKDRWRLAVNTAINLFIEYLKRCEDGKWADRYRWFRQNIEHSLKLLRELRLDEQPPLFLRLTCMEFEASLRKRDVIGYYEVKIDRIIVGNEVPAYEIYDLLIKKFYEIAEKDSLVKVHPAIAAELTQWTKKRYDAGETFKFCTCCGLLPSIIEIPERTCELVEGGYCKTCERKEECLEKQVYERMMPPRERIYFATGEKLCGWCLIKRLMSYPEVFQYVCEVLIGKVKDKIELQDFPSLADIATIPFKHEILKCLEDFSIVEKHPKIAEDICESYHRAFIKWAGGYKEEFEQLSSLRSQWLKGWRAYQQLLEEFNKLKTKITPELFDRLLCYFLSPSEETLLEVRVLKDSRKIRDILMSAKKTRIEFTPYYALIRADGDFMGKLMSGFVGEALGVDPLRWLKNVSIGELQGVIKRLVKRAKGSLAEKEWGELVDDIIRKTEEGREVVSGRLTALIERLKQFKEEGRILVSPTYHASISRALMVQSMVDLFTVEDMMGFVAYAGGDDLLAISPVASALEIAYKTREVFSRGAGDGFHLKFHALIPSLGHVGRSYCITFAHYKYPLSMVIYDSYYLLEGKKGIVTAYGGSKWEKDVCFIAYQPRGGGLRVSRLPLKERGNLKYGSCLDIASEIGNYIWSGGVSRRLIYEFLENEIEIESLFGERELLLSYMRYLIGRHVRSKEIGEEVLKRFELLSDFKIGSGETLRSVIMELLNTISSYFSARSG